MVLTKVKVRRRLPNFKDLAQLLRFRKPIISSKKRRLSRALTIYDLRKI
ncbi:MAG: alpha-hydroxy-acid oxidizing enzyme, partial [Actinobacteria bacterium]|nr:alpha-hydroxy-acid oxidizing enzyme [Actinomycetota bacterium]